MDKDRKLGLMVQSMKESTWKDASMVKESTPGLMDLLTAEDGVTIRFGDSVHINGLTVECTLVNGRTTTCTDLANIPGQMEEDIRVST